MSEEIKKFLNLFKSKSNKNKDGADSNQSADGNQESDIIKSSGGNHNAGRQNSKSRICKNDFYPQRTIFIWGLDNDNNPSFLVLYGLHKFKSIRYGENELEENVIYSDYTIFRGKAGHFPSFEAVKIEDNYNYSSRTSSRKMYYKKDLRSTNYWNRNESMFVEDYRNIEKEKLSFPYFIDMEHEDYVRILNEKGLKFENFKPVDSPEQVLALEDELMPFIEDIKNLFSDSKIYNRKKILKQLMETAPAEALYAYILKVGSSELISGVFLELAHRKDGYLEKSAENIVNSNINWTSEAYAKGIQRCAQLYINSLNSETIESRRMKIRETLPDMDLHLISIKNKKLPEDKILEGAAYRKYYLQGYLSEYASEYSYEQRKYIRKRRSALYKKSEYSDGTTLNITQVKGVLQEADIYGMPDIVGQIGYYMDAPRLTYYFRGNSNYKGLLYFRRYIRRIINSYAVNNEEYFMAAMKSLLTSYDKYDYVCKFKNNFQFNYFIKYYLYHNFDAEAPDGWYERYVWMEQDQLLKQTKRMEYMSDIWDRHLEDVADIIIGSKIDVILNAMYYIIKDRDYKEQISFAKMVMLTGCSYPPIADMFLTAVKDRLDYKLDFDMDIMMPLMDSRKKEIREMALDYLRRTGGKFTAEDLVSILLSDNLEDWMDLLQHCISEFNNEEYIQFLSAIIMKSDQFAQAGFNYTNEIKDIFEACASKLQMLSYGQKVDFVSFIMEQMCNLKKIPDFIMEIMESAIFSMSLSELKDYLQGKEITYNFNQVTKKSDLILSLLSAAATGTLPSDSRILEILEIGSSQMIQIFIQMTGEHREQLYNRHSTLLLMLESEVTMLNQRTEEVFKILPPDIQKELHLIIIDSPVQRAYSFGIDMLNEVYEKNGLMIPEEFMIRLLEHPAPEVKSYISHKANQVIKELGGGNKDLFLYYVRTLLLLPNQVSIGKKNIYEALPAFAAAYGDKQAELEELLLNIGGSNIILDSERALVTLAKIKKEVV